jgi:hypothetical protein
MHEGPKLGRNDPILSKRGWSFDRKRLLTKKVGGEREITQRVSRARDGIPRRRQKRHRHAATPRASCKEPIGNKASWLKPSLSLPLYVTMPSSQHEAHETTAT